MSQTSNKKFELIEKLGVLFENKGNMAPVEARIFAYIILTGKMGSTFEDLTNDLKASKSTISTHLNHLQSLKKIKYFTKTGDRKRYFIHNKEALIEEIGSLVSGWKSERQLHFEIIDYKNEVNKGLKDEDKFELSLHQSFIEFFDGAIASISKLEKNIKNKY